MCVALLAPVIAVALAVTPCLQDQAAPPVDLLVRMFLAQRERAAWQAEADGDPEALGSLLADEFLYMSDWWLGLDKDEVLEEVKREAKDVSFEIRINEYRKIGDTQIVTYELRVGEQGADFERSWHTSVWMRRDGRWRVVFHQELGE